MSRLFIAVATLSIACACVRSEPVVVRSTATIDAYHFSDPVQQERFKSALTSEGVPFTTEVRDGDEFIRWRPENAEGANAIRTRLFGPDLPSGRNISFAGEMEQRFKEWLTERSIPYETVQKDGLEYVIWEPSVDEQVKAYPYFPSTQK